MQPSGKPVSGWFWATSVKLADVKTDSQWKKSLFAHKEALGDKARNPTAACQGTISASRDIECPGCLTVFWLTSNRKYRAGCFSIIAIYLRRVSPSSSFVEIVVEIDTTISPLFVANQAGALRNYEALSYRDTSYLDWSRKWTAFLDIICIILHFCIKF